MTAGALIVAVVYLALAARLPAGAVEQPGPGLFPLGVGGLMLLAALGTAFEARRRPAALMPGRGSGSAPVRVGVLAAALGTFCLALPLAGYVPSAFGLGLVTARLFGQGRWLRAAALAAFLAIASWVGFAVALGVPLPAGAWAP